MRNITNWIGRAFMYDELTDVFDFNTRFRLSTSKTPHRLASSAMAGRVSFINEELDELCTAVKDNDLPGQADALIDLVYVIKGTAIMMGLPWEELWQDVQRANMAKVITGPRSGGDDYHLGVAKPLGWVGPRTATILKKHGWQP